MIENPEGPDKPSICVPESGACEHLIDGGVVQNNPSIYAMSIAMMIADARKLAGGSDEARPIRLLSIGTGGSPAFDRI
jgi:patatin-like phospholipase/acyl hydrolase